MSFFSESLGLSDSSFVILRDLIHEKTGLYFENGKREVLADKLSERVIENGFSSFIDYYYKLKYDEDSEEEWKKLLNCITVNETYFWREYDQIQLLVDYFIPEYFKNGNTEPFNIWCAACSTGEEPYTIAMSINEKGYFAKYPIKIYASDASTKAIETAISGLYRERSFRSCPEEIRERYFFKQGNLWRIQPYIQEKVIFNTRNLLDVSSSFPIAICNVIFCRNVFIYFSDQAVIKVINHFYDKLTNDGILFVGVSESLLKLTTKYDLMEKNNTFFYIKEKK